MFFRKKHPEIGARPGTIVVDESAVTPRIRVIDYTAKDVDEREIHDVSDLDAYRTRDSVTWIDVQGLGSETVLRQIADIFSFHPLLLEDIVNVPQRPKIEPYEDQLLVIGRMVRIEGEKVVREQLTLCVGEHYVMTFQQEYGDVFDPVRARIRAGLGAIRRAGPDYLAYALLDLSVDAYYPVVEFMGDRLEALEEEVLIHAEPESLKKIFEIKRDLLELRRSLWPQREVYSALTRDDQPFMSGDTRLYFRDVLDHCVQIIDVVETYRELAASLVDIYMSTVSNSMNEVMKVLTIMASIFIPVTFLAGVYGMNFEAMPELRHPLAYPAVIATMAAVAAGMLGFFWHKGWIGNKNNPRR